MLFKGKKKRINLYLPIQTKPVKKLRVVAIRLQCAMGGGK